MKNVFIILLVAFCFKNSFSQDESEVIKVRKDTITEQAFIVVEQMPTFPGGQDALFKYIARKVVHPDSLREQGIQGKVYCEFIVEKDGSITNEKIVRSPHPAFNETVLNAVREMPNWEPGMQRGKAVRVKLVLPVSFRVR